MGRPGPFCMTTHFPMEVSIHATAEALGTLRPGF